MGAVNTTYTFTATDTITSTKMNNIIDQTTMTGDAILGTTLEVVSGQLKIRSQGITSNELASNAVVTTTVLNNAITNEKIATKDSFVPTGAVMAFAMNAAPTGWLAANGAAVSRTTYAALHAVIGTLYGVGDVSTTFNLPDLRGYFVRGSGTNVDGAVSGTFGVKQADTFQGHTHTQTMGVPYDDYPNSSNMAARANRTGGSGTISLYVESDGTNGAPRASNETRPKNIAMLYCIKY